MNKEVPGPRRWAAIAVGFLGVIIVLRPDLGTIGFPAIAALASSLIFAFALALSRDVAEADGSLSVFVSSVIITAILSMPIAWNYLSLPFAFWPLAVLAVVIAAGAIRGFADIQAYRVGEASILAPFVYTRIIFIGLGAYLFFGEVPEQAAINGAIIIIAAALYIADRERKAASKKAL